MNSAPAAGLVEKLPDRQTVLVTGATGFIGSRLVASLTASGHQVIALVRNPAKAELPPPITLITSLDQIPADTKIDTIVNLAGEPIGNGLWTEAKRRKILEFRIQMTGDVVDLIGRLERKPKVLVSGSAIGWYGLWQDQVLTESAKSHACFSHELCDAWENAARPAAEHGVRVAYLRIGLVIGTDGGFITRMLTPFEFGLGGPLGSGKQWMSWIERDDLVRLIAHVIASPGISGPINATAPIPVTNLKFTEELGRRLHRPAVFRIPASLLRRVGGDFANELLLGRPEGVAEQGAEQWIQVPPRNAAQRVRGDLVKGTTMPRQPQSDLVHCQPMRCWPDMRVLALTRTATRWTWRGPCPTQRMSRRFTRAGCSRSNGSCWVCSCPSPQRILRSSSWRSEKSITSRAGEWKTEAPTKCCCATSSAAKRDRGSWLLRRRRGPHRQPVCYFGSAVLADTIEATGEPTHGHNVRVVTLVSQALLANSAGRCACTPRAGQQQ